MLWLQPKRGGVSSEAITAPLFEQLASSDNTTQSNNEPTLSAVDESVFSGEPAALVNVTLTRPMLSLDDEEIEVMVEKIVEPVLSPEEDIAEVAPLELKSIEVLANEHAAPESVTLNPQQMVQAWLDAWEGQDLEQYFASYDDGFVSRYHHSRSAWQSNRERVIGNASQISLEMSDFVLISEDAESVEVHFWLAHSSPSYHDDTRKKLILKKLPASDQVAARLVILEEINLEVRV